MSFYVTRFHVNYKGYRALITRGGVDNIYYGRILGIKERIVFQHKDAITCGDKFAKAVEDHIIKKFKSMKQDKKLVAGTEAYEVAYIATLFAIPYTVVKKAIKQAGRSRRAVYSNLRAKGYTIIAK